MNRSTKAPSEACAHSVPALTGLGNGRRCYECVKCGAVGLASTEQASAVSPPALAKLPPLPFAVFDEFGASCEDRVQDHYASALEQQQGHQSDKPAGRKS